MKNQNEEEVTERILFLNGTLVVELGFADDILKRSEANDMEIPQVSMMY